jgi:Zn-dependent protease with chaperone function
MQGAELTAMANPETLLLFCPNGHGGAAPAGVRFCGECGAPFVPAPSTNPFNASTPAPGTIPATGYPQPMAPPPGYPQPMAPMQPPSAPGYPQSGQPPIGYPQQTAPMPGRPPYAAVPVPVSVCTTCGGDGSRLPDETLVCPQCRWLRPLAQGYSLPPEAFQSGADSAAMAKLRGIAPLTALARTVSDRVGRRWVETSFNAIRLGENQLPDIYALAIRAARLLAMPSMPDIYVSGDKMWDAITYGSDRSAFVLIGTALLNNYRENDLLFLLAREMGHCRVGHALWKTVGTFLMGQQGPHKGMMSDGILAALNPQRLVEGAIEVPFLMWARQAEITADRAGLLAVGDEETARRVLLSWSLRSLPLYRQINIESWLQQQEDGDDQMTRISEMLSSPTPFITRRLKLLTQFAQSSELAQLRDFIAPLAQAALPPKPPTAPAVPPDMLRVACPTCGTGMRIPRAEMAGKDVFRVRCPKAGCGNILTLKKGGTPPSPPPNP